MKTYTLKTEIHGDIYAIAADFINPASPIFQLAENDEWTSTQYQVADFSDPEDALKQIMIDSLSYGGEIDKNELDSAVKKAEWI